MVYKGVYKDKEIAVKELIADVKLEDAFLEIGKEIEFILAAQNTKLPQLYGIIVDEKEKVGLVFEFIKGYSLDRVYHTMNPKEKIDCVVQLCDILCFLHSKKLIHRDIKPENVMFRSRDDLSSIKLIDLGLFTRVEDHSDFCHDTCGTLYYMAPEINSLKPVYNELVDIWACGVILYLLLSGGCHPVVKPSEWSNEKDYIKKLNTNKNHWKFSDDFPR